MLLLSQDFKRYVYSLIAKQSRASRWNLMQLNNTPQSSHGCTTPFHETALREILPRRKVFDSSSLNLLIAFARA